MNIYVSRTSYNQHTVSHTRLGLKLNFLMPSRRVVFFCFALSNFVGSSETGSGVGILLDSERLGAADNLSIEFSGVIVSARTSSPGTVGGRLPGSPGDSVFGLLAVPHTTSDFRTATRHSKLCLRNLGSESPRPELSMVPETANALVLSAGATEFEWFFEVGCKAGLVGSWPFCGT